MNNNQFRKLVVDAPASQNAASATPRTSGTPAALGGKRSSIVSMTPRAVKGGIGVDFARQVRERNVKLQPTKKFKSSTPKGVRYGTGYTDRAKAREAAEEVEDNKEARITALEQQMKLGQISVEIFEALRDEITGGDISSTHLVKGLDRRLLERVRRGEDVLSTVGSDSPAAPPSDIDDELEKLGGKEVEAVKREKIEKKGSVAPPSAVGGKKRSRDEIMAELKAQRQAAAQARAVSMLDGRWRKVGEREKNRVEIDHKGREVLITVDEDGVVKKKVRNAPALMAGANDQSSEMAMPDANKPILGADIPLPERQLMMDPDEDEDEDVEDIFEGAGTEYNPLGDEEDDNDYDEVSGDETTKALTSDLKPSQSKPEQSGATESESTICKIGQTSEMKLAAPHHSYFGTKKNDNDEGSKNRFAGIQDVLKKAAQLEPLRSDEDDRRDSESDKAREARVQKRTEMLAQQDRDLDDMDMGFDSSRYEDEEDGGGDVKMRLSEWKSATHGDDRWEEDGKRKRKPKKRKGDVNNAADIMRVIEGRKAGSTK